MKFTSLILIANFIPAYASGYQCGPWPTGQGTKSERCLHGNTLNDGFEWVFNDSRGTDQAQCGSCHCCRRPETFFPEPYTIKRSDVSAPIAVFKKPLTDYTLEFNITLLPNSWTSSSYNSIIRFCNTTTKGGGYGHRNPSIWLKEGRPELLIVTGTNEDPNLSKVLDRVMPYNEELQMKLQVQGDVSSFFINGNIADEWPVGAREPIAELKMYVGDPWYPAAQAEISNIRFSTSNPTLIDTPTTASPITTSPTTTFHGEDYEFKNLESTFVDDEDGFAIALTYTVGKSVNRLDVALLDENCTNPNIDSIININTDEGALSNVQFLKKVSVNKQELSKSTLVTRSEGSSKGTLSFCVKAEGISENGISVSFQQDKLNLSYDLTNNTFEVLSNGLKADDIDTTSKNVATSYSIIAHRCTSSTYEETDLNTPLQQNALVFICIEPNSTDVEISTFNLNFVQGEFTFQVVNLGVESSILSSVSTEGDKIKIVSRLVSAFFNSDTDTFDASGDANLVFKTARRKLDSLRSLSDKDNAGEASFGMNVKLQNRIVPQKQSHNIPQTALSVLGTCVLLSVLLIAIKKLKRKD